MNSDANSTPPLVRVVFAPRGSGRIWEKALTRLFVATGLIPKTASCEDAPVFVILWHLGTYSWPGADDTNVKKVLSEEWLNLARQLSAAGGKARLLILMPEEPQSLSRQPRAMFFLPDLLFKSVLHDRHHEASEVPHARPMLWCTYQQLSETLEESAAPSQLTLWDGSHAGDSMLIRFCYAMAAFPIRTQELSHPRDEEEKSRSGSSKGELIRHDDLFRFGHDPRGYRVVQLHGSRAEKASGDQGLTHEERRWARKVSALEHTLSRVLLPPTTPLKVLVVENDWHGLTRWDEKSAAQHRPLWEGVSLPHFSECFGYFAGAEFYVLEQAREFEKLRSSVERHTVRATLFTPHSDDNSEKQKRGPVPVPWEHLDLVLQDVMLDRSACGATGLQYTPYYLEACPQALVVVLTGMDVESLAMSGDIDWKYVDAVVAKRKLGSLWWTYYQAFCRVYGRMFWDAFTDERLPEQRGVIGDIENREDLRLLFASLRRWQMEPAVLSHGQGVAEMIDHAHRHVSGVWRLADDFIGSLVENTASERGTSVLRNRMLFSLAVWLHDIGHRGNEFTDDPADVRINHSGISEYLLLRNPEAYGATWLTQHCQVAGGADAAAKGDAARPCLHLVHRNAAEPCEPRERQLCPLRLVGLLCRHHQSNAPLDAGSLRRMCERGKFPSPYSRYKDDGSSRSSQDDLEQWLDRAHALAGWSGSGVRLLEDFNVGCKADQMAFMAWVGLLRMLDGLQVHRTRVGSPASLSSFLEYLNVRGGWCDRELARLDELVSRMRPGSKEYQDHIARRLTLERYSRLLQVQYVHWWRQLAVHEVKIIWHWRPVGLERRQPASPGTIEVQFTLDDAGLKMLTDLQDLRIGNEKYDLYDILNTQYQVEIVNETRKLENTNPRDRNPEVTAKLAQLERLVSHLSGVADTDRLTALWSAHVFAEIIWPEHSSQFRQINGKLVPYYLDLLPVGATLEITVKGRVSHPLENPIVLLQYPI